MSIYQDPIRQKADDAVWEIINWFKDFGSVDIQEFTEYPRRDVREAMQDIILKHMNDRAGKE